MSLKSNYTFNLITSEISLVPLTRVPRKTVLIDKLLHHFDIRPLLPPTHTQYKLTCDNIRNYVQMYWIWQIIWRLPLQVAPLSDVKFYWSMKHVVSTVSCLGRLLRIMVDVHLSGYTGVCGSFCDNMFISCYRYCYFGLIILASSVIIYHVQNSSVFIITRYLIFITPY